jgi:DNA-binding response OmpR family regulator
MSLLNDDSPCDDPIAPFQGTIMLSKERLLIVEDVYLIALDIQRVLEGENAVEPVFARDFAQAARLGDLGGMFDLAIVNPPLPGSEDMKVAERLAAAGVPIVVCTAARIDLSDTPLARAEIVVKPFADDDLVAACRRALEKRQPQKV